MIIAAKESRAGGRASPTLEYLLGRDEAGLHTDQHIVDGIDYPGLSKGKLIEQIASELQVNAELAGLSPQCKHIHHVAISLSPEETARLGGGLTDEKWQAITQDYVTSMGWQDAPYVVVRHGLNAGGGDHVHLVMSDVTRTGARLNMRNYGRRSGQVATGLEQRHGLEVLQSRLPKPVTKVPTVTEPVSIAPTFEPPVERVPSKAPPTGTGLAVVAAVAMAAASSNENEAARLAGMMLAMAMMRAADRQSAAHRRYQRKAALRPGFHDSPVGTVRLVESESGRLYGMVHQDGAWRYLPGATNLDLTRWDAERNARGMAALREADQAKRERSIRWAAVEPGYYWHPDGRLIEMRRSKNGRLYGLVDGAYTKGARTLAAESYPAESNLTLHEPSAFERRQARRFTTQPSPDQVAALRR